MPRAMIRCFGLHWHLDRVSWGKQKVPGTLLGTASTSHLAHPIDFRYQRGIYALYADYALVYVGQAGAGQNRLFNRLKKHRTDHLSERWNRFSWFGVRWVTQQSRLSADAQAVPPHDVVTALNILEAVVIAVGEPRLNLRRGKWGNAKQYYQYWRPTTDE